MKNYRLLKLSLLSLLIFSGCTVSPEVKEKQEIVFKGHHYDTVVSPYTKRVWLDRNLGATQVCTSVVDEACMGDYYQWGNGDPDTFVVTRFAGDWDKSDPDGMKRSAFLSLSEQGICPTGFRVPNKDELFHELFHHVGKNLTPFELFLKIPYAGYKSTGNKLKRKDKLAYLWTSARTESSAVRAGMYANGHPYVGGTTGMFRAEGYSVRCIQAVKEK